MKKIIIIGGRGNGTVIASTIEDCRRHGQEIEFAGFLNDNETEINNYPVLGGIINQDWKIFSEDYYFIYAMSNVKQAHERHRLLKDLHIPLARFVTVVHPTAVVSDKATLGAGVVLMPMALVSPNAFIGNHSQMYAQSFIGHDSRMEEMVFVANNASIGGRVVIKDGAHIGSNCSIIERLTISEYSVIGVGSVILNDTAPYEKMVGNPAKSIGKLKIN